jgi:hypothetical protein
MEMRTSHGFPLAASPAGIGPLREVTGVTENAAGLRERMTADGYLLLRGTLDREVVAAARGELLEKLASVGEIDASHPLDAAVYSGGSRRAEGDARAFAKSLRTGPAVRQLCHQGRVIEFYERFLGGAVRPFDYIWVRTVRPGGATGCHFDWVYMGRGTRSLYTSWIPLGAVTLAEGPLAILEGSHRLEELQRTYGAIDVDRDRDRNPYGGGWYSRNPAEVQERLGGRWLTTEFEPGDMLVFSMFILHCSLDNRSDRIRLSTDSRYQLAADPADERWIGEDPAGHGG